MCGFDMWINEFYFLLRQRTTFRFGFEIYSGFYFYCFVERFFFSYGHWLRNAEFQKDLADKK